MRRRPLNAKAPTRSALGLVGLVIVVAIRRERRNAFTIVEVVLVMAILALLAGIAVPRYGNFIARQHVEAAARRITVDLALAQRRARSTSTSQTVYFNVAGDSYSLVGMPHPDHSSLEYRVLLTEAPYGTRVVSADFGGDQEIIFDVFGIPDSGGSVVIRVGDHVRTITVDASMGIARAQ